MVALMCQACVMSASEKRHETKIITQVLKTEKVKLIMEVQACKPSIQKAESGRFSLLFFYKSEAILSHFKEVDESP